jgi:hypothetical protein
LRTTVQIAHLVTGSFGSALGPDQKCLGIGGALQRAASLCGWVCLARRLLRSREERGWQGRDRKHHELARHHDAERLALGMVGGKFAGRARCAGPSQNQPQLRHGYGQRSYPRQLRELPVVPYRTPSAAAPSRGCSIIRKACAEEAADQG